MDQSLTEVSGNMLRLGLGALAHANWHAHYYSMDNDCWSELSVLQAAHAAEILIKARIAQEHPLLIFEHTPKLAPGDTATLTFARLVQEGRTFQFADLPNRLWATTGIALPMVECYAEFGRTRNSIQHFAPPCDGAALSQLTLEFIFSVIDPFINHCWGKYAIDFNEDYEPYAYFVPGIIARGIPFLVSPQSVVGFEHMAIEWGNDADYKKLMQTRIKAATSQHT